MAQVFRHCRPQFLDGLRRNTSRNSRSIFSSQTLRLSTDNANQEAEIKKFDANPLDVHDYFGVRKLFGIKDLFDSRVHLGHTVTSIHPNMSQFVFGERFGQAVIDLNSTSMMLIRALNFVAHIAYRDGIILFVCRQPQFVHLVEKAATESGEFAHCKPWDTKIFTAPLAVFGGETRLPDTIILFHTKDGTKYDDHQIIVDAAKVAIPTVAVVDTDCNPNIISYPVPGNDDTIQSMQLYLHLFKQAILLGKKQKRIDEGSSSNK